MKREPSRLAERTFDLLVIGAGVYGAWAAWDAALRGLSVGVIDRGDFGGATSANNLRVIHGGLRYVQHLDFHRMRESIREQRALMHVAPHLVHPMMCAVPTYGRGRRSRLAFRVALAINDLMGRNRGRETGPGKAIPKSKIVKADRMLELAPGIPEHRLTGGAIWHDAQVLDPERLVLAILRSADDLGAAVANHVEADSLLVKKGGVVGARVTDRLTGESFFVRARVTLNLSGPWVDRLLAASFPGKRRTLFPLTQAWNLVLRRRLPPQLALGLYSRRPFKDRDRRFSLGTRLLFFTPWRDVTLVGTSHRPFDAGRFGRGGVPLDEDEVLHLLEEASEAYPEAEIRFKDVAFAFGGLLPGTVDPGTGHVRLMKHPVIRDHARADGIPGLLTGVGVKFTTARLVAEKLVDLVASRITKETEPCRTGTTRLKGAEIDDWPAFFEETEERRSLSLAPLTHTRLVENHGLDYEAVLQHAHEEEHLLDPVADGSPVLKAEVIHAVREEMAVKLLDVIRRRTHIGKCGLPNEHVARSVAALMGEELGWDPARREAEVAEVLEAYGPFLGKGLQRDTRQ